MPPGIDAGQPKFDGFVPYPGQDGYGPYPDGPVIWPQVDAAQDSWTGPDPDSNWVLPDKGTVVKPDSAVSYPDMNLVFPEAGTPPPPPTGSMMAAAVQYGPGLYANAPGCTDDNCAVAYYVTQAAGQGATFVVTPEAALDQSDGQYVYPEYHPTIGTKPATHPYWAPVTQNGVTYYTVLGMMAQLADDLDITLVFNMMTYKTFAGTGSCTSDADCADDEYCSSNSSQCIPVEYYNANIAVNKDGVVLQTHIKYHLYSGESSTYTAGSNCVDAYATPAGQTGMLICADIQCVFYLTSGTSPSSCLAIDKVCLPAYKAAGLNVTAISAYWMATGSQNPVWKATTSWGIFAGYSQTYVVAANTIGGSSMQYHGGGIYKPDGTAIDIYDSTTPGFAIGLIPKPGTQPPPTSNDIVITEFMANPGAVLDTAGEWFEVYNAGSSTVDMVGWSIKDSAGNSHTISSSVTVGAGQYVVLGVNDSAASNGGAPVAYDYGSWSLTNTEDQILLYDASNNLVDSVEYNAAWPITSGASLSLKSTSADNNIATNWCVETSAWSGSDGDYGTPGAAAGCN